MTTRSEGADGMSLSVVRLPLFVASDFFFITAHYSTKRHLCRHRTMSRSFSSSTSTTLAVSIAIIGTAAASYCYHRITINRLACQYNEKRLAERKGRIRAEIKLRSALKQRRTNHDSNSMTLKCIGTVVSPFTKRMGTPRQG